MNVFVNIKKAGSKRPALSNQAYELPFNEASLKDILAFFVETEVNRYNGKGQRDALLYLTQQDLADAASQGKVDFGYTTGRTADLDTAIKNALLCFEDGLIRVFLNETELTELDSISKINENDRFTFIRLSFLSGRPY